MLWSQTGIFRKIFLYTKIKPHPGQMGFKMDYKGVNKQYRGNDLPTLSM
ncbi:MAG: hypothetical protein HPY66_0688 [Firmicutes bacterium]|nr:hypothetical protein [Bacillota bacterium]